MSKDQQSNAHADAVLAQLRLAEENGTLPDDLDDEHTIRPAQRIPCPYADCDHEFSDEFAADRHCIMDHAEAGRYRNERRSPQGKMLLPDGGQQTMKKVGFRLPKGLHDDLEAVAEAPGSHFENKSDAFRTAVMRFVREERERRADR